VHFGTPVADILALIREVGATDSDDLEVAALELADASAPPAIRITARQKLKSFLIRNGSRLEASTFASVWKWAESQIGSL
jgi:hypothetical protein